MPESGPCSGGPIEAVFHVYNAGIGVCGCGAELTKAEWRQHYLEATAPENGPCCATPLRPSPPAADPGVGAAGGGAT